ncbi:outer membrane protein transport protein [Roseovarius sp. EL26]|uniref:outer membrane protein transport protein n=1 Tax=Roseovarius sp. EL26 TaxID=2126672 RepID=UPI000EA223A5|nr:outer membrane protein transport protein [Roseovarius sp. EL26]
MKYQGLITATFATAAIASMADAGSIERAGDPSQILFEEGKNYLEFSAAVVTPYISGTPNATSPSMTPIISGGVTVGAAAVGGTGNITDRYITGALGYKHQLNDQVALAFTIDEPVGADVNYTAANAVFAGSNADVSSRAFTALAKYQTSENFSVYGGLRLQTLRGNVTVVGLNGALFNYNLNVGNDYKLGYLLGAAYEKPEIALRVALTYESAIEHDFRDNNGTEFDVEIPQAFTLHAQTGIATDTLLFGSVRWREWSKFNIAPPDFVSLPGNRTNSPIASEPDDIWTYELGLGRRFNENWSGAALLGYESDHGKPVGNLSGKDGYISYGLAATYETETWEITTGVKYFDMGSAETSVSSFSGNDVIAFGMKLGFRF